MSVSFPDVSLMHIVKHRFNSAGTGTDFTTQSNTGVTWFEFEYEIEQCCSESSRWH